MQFAITSFRLVVKRLAEEHSYIYRCMLFIQTKVQSNQRRNQNILLWYKECVTITKIRSDVTWEDKQMLQMGLHLNTPHSSPFILFARTCTHTCIYPSRL